MTIGLPPDALSGRNDGRPAGRPANALKPGFDGVRTHWNLGFMAFKLADAYAAR